MQTISRPAVLWSMGKLFYGLVLFTIGGVAYFWLNSEIPGGEKRYEHYIREAKDRGPTGLP